MGQNTMQSLYNEAVTSLAKGISARSIIESLVQRGIPADAANVVVAEANKIKKAAFRKAGLKLFLTGIFYIIAGAVITGILYSIAEPGGFFIVTTGLFIVGAANIFRGLFRIIAG